MIVHVLQNPPVRIHAYLQLLGTRLGIDLGPNAEALREAIRRPVKSLAFSPPRNVAASDDAMWVADLNQRSLIKAALFYRVEGAASIPD